MIHNVKRFDSSKNNVFKYVFTGDDYIAESVLYRYNDFYERTVICCSVMSGCPVGCTFCGTGNKFIRNLTDYEITRQIKYILYDWNIEDIDEEGERFQIMFMSMGEPFLNYENVRKAIVNLHNKYPNAELLISTIAPHQVVAFNDFIRLSKQINKIGLQFSIHQPTDKRRDILIPYKYKENLNTIRDMGMTWMMSTGRKPYLNYCITGDNNTIEDAEILMARFSPIVFNFTFSVVCSSDETMADAGFHEIDTIRKFEEIFLKNGYNTRIFDPAGQDDIGGGCGQLWYVQKWLKENE